jgi:hypothetical protein
MVVRTLSDLSGWRDVARVLSIAAGAGLFLGLLISGLILYATQ